MTPLELRPPVLADGAALWELAQRAGGLDVNSSYAYVLWCRDFAATSVLALDGGSPAGFVTGYVRPDDPDVLMVWQVAVSPDHRRRGVAAAMLDHVVGVLRSRGCTHLETTVTPGNEASRAMFASLASRWGVGLDVSPLFGSGHFPDPHDPEELLRLGPFA